VAYVFLFFGEDACCTGLVYRRFEDTELSIFMTKRQTANLLHILIDSVTVVVIPSECLTLP
jgi:hypothetical protein